MPFGGVKVQGIREVQKALRDVDRSLPGEMRRAGNDAAELVVAAAKRRAGTRMERRAAQTLRVSSQQRSVAVTLGNARTPFALGAEFGSVRYPQFRAWRGSDRDAGYFLYPAIRAESAGVVAAYLDGVARVVHAANLS